MLHRVKGVAVAGLVLVLVGCQGQAGSVSREHDIKGVVVTVDTGSKTLELDHEEIPGFMKAMRRTYAVADVKLLEGLKAGDSVRGKLEAAAGNYTITSLERR
jgi:Cu/Ag efflux protein CusF